MLHNIKTFFFPTPVETEEQALDLGERLAHSLYTYIPFDNYIPQVCSNDDEWLVYYCLKGPDGLINHHILGGGGPEIHIRKKDGKLLNIFLQK